MAEDTKEPKINIKSGTVIGSTYSQIGSVVVSDVDVTLEFIYINPRQPITEGNVVARITMPRASADGMAKAIVNTIKEHEEKKGKKNG
jgi:hypothetical protein